MTKETTLNEFNDSNALNEIHEVEEKMKISTAEIKIYIIECVKTYGMYTNDDFKKYCNVCGIDEQYVKRPEK